MSIKAIQSGNRRSSLLYAVTFADGVTVELGKNYGPFLNSTARLNADLQARLAGRPERIFLHLNRDKTVAVATARQPDVWPEDEKD